jgi:hypothetical protein
MAAGPLAITVYIQSVVAVTVILDHDVVSSSVVSLYACLDRSHLTFLFPKAWLEIPSLLAQEICRKQKSRVRSESSRVRFSGLISYISNR